jgi:hypothetical protein
VAEIMAATPPVFGVVAEMEATVTGTSNTIDAGGAS